MRREKTKDMILCGMFVALIAAGAFIKIPIPVIPFTLQYLFTMMAGLLLGPKKGCLAVLIYILLGLMGLPIFAQGGGIGYLVSPASATWPASPQARMLQVSWLKRKNIRESGGFWPLTLPGWELYIPWAWPGTG